MMYTSNLIGICCMDETGFYNLKNNDIAGRSGAWWSLGAMTRV